MTEERKMLAWDKLLLHRMLRRTAKTNIMNNYHDRYINRLEKIVKA
jgi:hypothetical protein